MLLKPKQNKKKNKKKRSLAYLWNHRLAKKKKNGVQKIFSSPGRWLSLYSQFKQRREQSQRLFQVYLLAAAAPFVFSHVKFLLSSVRWLGQHWNGLKAALCSHFSADLHCALHAAAGPSPETFCTICISPNEHLSRASSVTAVEVLCEFCEFCVSVQFVVSDCCPLG